MLHAPLPCLILPNLSQAHAPLRLMIDIRICNLWDKMLRLPRFADDAVELIDLLEGQALCLVDHGPSGILG